MTLVERLRWSGQDAMTKHLSLGMAKLHGEAADVIEELLVAAIGLTDFLNEKYRNCENVSLHNPDAWLAYAPLLEAIRKATGGTMTVQPPDTQQAS